MTSYTLASTIIHCYNQCQCRQDLGVAFALTRSSGLLCCVGGETGVSFLVVNAGETQRTCATSSREKTLSSFDILSDTGKAKTGFVLWYGETKENEWESE